MARASKVVLAYSGGVDTSVCIPYLKKEYGVEEVIAFAADLGQGDELEAIKKKAILAGASESIVGNLVTPFIEDFAFPAIRSNALYQGKYPLSTALARPLIAKNLVEIARELNADGCHLGQSDTNFLEAKKILKNKIVGITCHNSIKLVKKAIINRANYVALGAFYSTKTKKVKYKASIKILNLVKKITNTPIVAIGGIKLNNYKKLLLNKANFLAISGYIWNNKKYKPLDAIKKLK